jgi:F-type H+-transporting ATPase subunit c
MRKTFFMILSMLALTAMPALAQADAAGSAAASKGWALPIAAAFGMAFAVGLAALGQGRVAGSACESLARNPAARPGIQLALILGLAFIESLVLFTLVIIFVKVA